MGDPAEKLYDDAMKLPASERRALALRLLASVSEPYAKLTYDEAKQRALAFLEEGARSCPRNA